MGAIDSEWLDARITRTKELILDAENGIAALSTGAQMYSLDTGQTRQMVSKAQLGQLQTWLESLENRLATLEARKCGASVYARPGF